MLYVISLGGSIVAPGGTSPEGVDSEYLEKFKTLILELLEADGELRFIFVTGGGAPARVYQNAYKAITKEAASADGADWIGVAATRLNAELVRQVFACHYAVQSVVIDPTGIDVFAGRILVAAGWKPGFSSDNDAVLLAERFGAKTVINLSNIAKVYTGDPKLDKNAKPLDAVSWDDFLKITGTQWVPGKNVPFDPVASKRAKDAGIKVICAAGKNLENLKCILLNKTFEGTTIG
jgi:uridylate kinase